MLRLLAELNRLGTVDIIFFVVCAVIIVACVAVYFLIPVINKKQYQEMRDNLSKREVAFKANAKAADDSAVEVEVKLEDKTEQTE